MDAAAQYMNLPFDEAIDFFRQKVSLPTESHDDLVAGMHSRAFVVAGATKSELLLDLRKAVDEAISEGTTLADFKRNFDSIVQEHGWNYKGGRGWRTAVIYDTNLTVAYSAGRYQQMSSPAVRAVRPYLRYLKSRSATPRKEHEKWYNLVLRYDDPFWDTHYPPNGYGCKCGVTSVSGRELERLEKEEADGGYPIHTKAPELETYEHLNRKTGEVKQVPIGIDPGWDYNPGQAAWGKQLSRKKMSESQAQKSDTWEQLTPGSWQTYGLPKTLELAEPKAEVGPKITDANLATQSLQKILGGEEKVFSLQGNDGFRYDLLVNAETLIDHIDLNRTPYLPLIPEVLTDPDEVWMRFDRHKATNRVVLRQRVIKMLSLPKGKKGMLTVFEAENGWITAWTMFPVTKTSYTNKQRSGVLMYSRQLKESQK